MRGFNYSFATFGICFLFLCSFNSAFADKKAPEEKKHTVYAQLSSLKTQTLNLNPGIAIFEKVDFISGLKVDDHKKVVIQESGIYSIISNAKVGIKGINLGGVACIWLNLNHEPIQCTLTSQTISSDTSASSMQTQIVMPLKKGDIISIGLSSSVNSLALVTEKIPGINKQSPSINLSIFKTDSR